MCISNMGASTVASGGEISRCRTKQQGSLHGCRQIAPFEGESLRQCRYWLTPVLRPTRKRKSVDLRSNARKWPRDRRKARFCANLCWKQVGGNQGKSGRRLWVRLVGQQAIADTMDRRSQVLRCSCGISDDSRSQFPFKESRSAEAHNGERTHRSVRGRHDSRWRARPPNQRARHGGVAACVVAGSAFRWDAGGGHRS